MMSVSRFGRRASTRGTSRAFDATTSELELDLAKICYIALKARAFDIQEDIAAEDEEIGPPSEGSGRLNDIDDVLRAMLQVHADNPAFAELKEAIDDLNIDEQCQLVALAWIGRGDFDRDGWDAALRLARQQHTEHTALYLIGMPLLSDYLEEGLAQFGRSCEELEEGSP